MSTFEQTVSGIVNDLLDDYENEKSGEELRIFNHPDKEVIIDILGSLRKIIFPGYFRNRSIKVYTLKNNLSMLIEDVIFKLTKQITIVLDDGETDNSEVLDKAREISLAFIKRLRTIREYILTDVQAAFDGDPAAYSEDEIIYSYPGLFAILVNRIAHELFLLNVPIIPRMMTEYAHNETGIDIHPGATIGKYFFIDHGTGIVIGETTVIGNNVKIYQGVTLGALSTRGGQALKSKKRHPTIEDNVTIYSGASILGGNTVIGKDVVIGGNAFITHSVPDGAKVSVKNQELRFNYDASHPVERVNIEEDTSWFYII
ncbi:serine O-acetyltransferase [Ruminococcus sp. YE71]|uniref:serine O-acetyltransferase n=1 Tax=unclassified Ruminococcus TaxID=2608920 RepID=UPI000883C38A|nr:MULTISPECIES: serine acetyltransferase [unclassified Ruminococcus]SDA13273.1 serine O-acetyltransferase [Ruminococcus sp. YE78]SFW18760.1 serine O-acetyltransferase [Ruminococcus sp. YE71]